MKKLITGIVLLFFILGCNKQEKTPLQKFKEDYDIFRAVFEQANAGLYKYHSKKEMDSLFSESRKLITDKTSYRDFYNIVWDIIDFTGSCHNQLVFPDSLDQLISKKKIFFPISLKYLNGKLYSITNTKDIPLGSEIISVNKTEGSIFAQTISQYVSTDGHNVTGKYAFIETDWTAFYIYLAYGAQDSFAIKYKKDGNTKTVNLKAVDYKTAVESYKNRFIPTNRHENKNEYSFRYFTDKTALLIVNTFALGGPESEGHKKYSVFLDSVFTELKIKQVQNIIVDVRQNGGGNDPNDLLLYSYLTKRNFRENTSAFTLFNTVPLKQYFVEEDKGEIEDLEQELKEEHNILKNGKYYQNDTFNKIWQPKKNAFQGKIYLLISPLVASAGSLCASMVKSDETSITIGQESLGGYYGHTGHIPVTYQLPNTGLLLTFSIVDLEQDVQTLPDEKYGDGIMPDYKIEPTIENYLNNIDPVLESTLELIKNR